ncbi:MAG: hypothetical protein QOJ04_3842, partial [Caballeronia sp.]|nr:hypothetical protein [Caballeronia sp.]
ASHGPTWFVITLNRQRNLFEMYLSTADS